MASDQQLSAIEKCQRAANAAAYWSHQVFGLDELVTLEEPALHALVQRAVRRDYFRNGAFVATTSTLSLLRGRLPDSEVPDRELCVMFPGFGEALPADRRRAWLFNVAMHHNATQDWLITGACFRELGFGWYGLFLLSEHDVQKTDPEADFVLNPDFEFTEEFARTMRFHFLQMFA